MKLLLDTHVVLWWLDDNPRLGRKARSLIADPTNQPLVSLASIWEIAIKHRRGKMAISAAQILDSLPDQGFNLLPIEPRHVVATQQLDQHHGDPFDHLILAQAAVEGAMLMTSDTMMRRYGIPCTGVD